MTNEEFIQSIALPGEEWRDVVGWEGLYCVSSFGRVCSVFTSIKDKKRDRATARRLKSLTLAVRNGKNYMTVRLSDGKARYVHRLVASAFIPNPNGLNEIDHIDRDGTNNKVSNLRWVTHQQNMNNENTRGAFSSVFLGRPAIANRKKIVQLDNGTIVRTYEKVSDVKLFGFSPSAVVNNLKGRSKNSGGFQWAYLSDYESKVSMSKNSELSED